MVEVNCETDFVAREQDFRAFAQQVAAIALAQRPPSLAAQPTGTEQRTAAGAAAALSRGPGDARDSRECGHALGEARSWRL